MPAPLTAAEIVEHLQGKVEGDGNVELVDVRPLAEAGPEHLLANRKVYRQLKATRAFGFAPSPAGHLEIPQTGPAVIEDAEIGANSCVDRAAMARLAELEKEGG